MTCSFTNKLTIFSEIELKKRTAGHRFEERHIFLSRKRRKRRSGAFYSNNKIFKCFVNNLTLTDKQPAVVIL